MIDITVARAGINSNRLHAELKAAFGDMCSGVSFGASGATAHLADGATLQQQQQAVTILANHDDSPLTDAQSMAELREAYDAATTAAARKTILRKAFDAVGADMTTMVEMLWEIVVQGRTVEETGAAALDEKREAVKHIPTDLFKPVKNPFNL